MANPNINTSGSSTIDMDALNREPSSQERAAAAEKAARDRAILESKGMMPGQLPIGTANIDPNAISGYDPNAWKGMTNNAIHGYASAKLGYNPYQTQAGPQMRGMNFNPYMQASRNQAHSQANAGLSQTSGMSGSDRMRAFSDFNRAKITGQLGGAAKIGQAQAQNAMDVGRFNSGREMDVQKANVDAFNTASQHKADAFQRRDQNLYAGALAENNLGRQLEISKLLSKSQGGGGSGGFLGSLWDGVDKLLGGIS